MNKEYDFIVGFTIFSPTGFKTMYRHFDKLETAQLFASNKNLKDNCKIYIDLDFYQKSQVDKNYISKDKIKEKIEETNSEKLNYSEDEYYLENEVKGYAIDKLKELLNK